MEKEVDKKKVYLHMMTVNIVHTLQFVYRLVFSKWVIKSFGAYLLCFYEV